MWGLTKKLWCQWVSQDLHCSRLSLRAFGGVDLQTIRNKVEFRQYKSVNDFVKDVTKMFDNCRYYNAPNTPFYRCAEVLEIYFVEKLKSLKAKL